MAYAVTDPAEAARRAVAGHFAARLRGAADPVPVLIDWAGALAARAGDLAGAAARHLLAEADVKLAAAGAVAPLPADGLIVWAEVTAALARRAETPAEADRLWRLAAERFSEAARRQPGRGDALVAWAGRLVARAAAAGDPEEAAPLHAEADDVFAQALRVAPGDYDALCDRAAALIAWAAITDDLDESDALLDRAETVCRAALTIAPTETYTLACIAALRGRTEDCREALEAAALAATLPPPEHLAGDEDLAAVRGEPWFRALLGPRPTAGAH
ncbi:hypothetical protein J2S22_005595 [Rhodoplanes tepidamans]|uniref:Tetratricopeptide repeat protein n=2 Tax=Rhodoplanes TaxID=29407 RepID=A0ABT5JHE5_RHOTP|nr:hypothetical protein [Rhodoplanes tepidamans]MDC7788947.1 hypothetical protein [Rhodoplanes tepidamans]MDQ0358641.1 hypothetical protein [Rhodoplanes tepidamans]